MLDFNDHDWWRHAVTYQIYPRSFADANNDGTGDVRGMISKIPHLVSLGIDAVWVSPWYPSPLFDGGYDVADYRDIEPDFGTLADADEFIAALHAQGIRILIDLVPNHCSINHSWFKAAIAAGPGSPEREHFIFKDGRGENGDTPPTNWHAAFGGGAWERVIGPDGKPEQWYLHMFAPEQPDWNWDNEEVRAEMDSVLRFWFDRGVDGFRVDVADALVKDPGFADTPIDPRHGYGTWEKYVGSPFWDRPGVADVQRRWRRLADSYADSELGGRIFCSEAYLPFDRLVEYVRPDRLQTAFNFEYLQCEWDALSLRTVIDSSMRAHKRVGASTTWVLNNHDVIRSVSRLGKNPSGRRFRPGVDPGMDGAWQLPLAAAPTDVDLGRRRGRPAAMLMFALPGNAYMFEGEELGLEEVEDLPEELLQDPTWVRSGHTERGRDGCRVPIPWSGDEPPFGFGVDAEPWLPQPAQWASLTAERQDADPGSMLNLYRKLLTERKNNAALGDGDLTWEETPEGVLSFTREPGFRCVVNVSGAPYPLPAGEVIIASGPLADGALPAETAVWLRR